MEIRDTADLEVCATKSVKYFTLRVISAQSKGSELLHAITFFSRPFLFQFGDALEQIRKVPDGDELPLHFLVWLRGCAEPFFAVGNVVHHTGPGGNDDSVSNFQMSGNANLSSEHNMISQLRAARDAGLSDDDAVLADFHVVRDLHQVVYLRPLADDRRAERAAVNRHPRADFHVVADDDVADLRHLAVDAAVLHVAETVRANHRVGVNAHAPANFRARVKGDVRK